MNTLLPRGILLPEYVKLIIQTITNKLITKKNDTSLDNISKGDRIVNQFSLNR